MGCMVTLIRKKALGNLPRAFVLFILILITLDYKLCAFKEVVIGDYKLYFRVGYHDALGCFHRVFVLLAIINLEGDVAFFNKFFRRDSDAASAIYRKALDIYIARHTCFVAVIVVIPSHIEEYRIFDVDKLNVLDIDISIPG